jgi:isoquinoline 1-oxidoreductase subunit alpha
MIRFTVNQKPVAIDVSPDTPLLWVLRDELKLTGTKFGCGIAVCGACTVHINGEATRSCVLPISAVEGMQVTSIEGLAPAANVLHALQQAWIAHQVPQCGYCQSGMLMAASSLLSHNANPSDADIDDAMSNICRCGTYPRVRKAIQSLLPTTRPETLGES